MEKIGAKNFGGKKPVEKNSMKFRSFRRYISMEFETISVVEGNFGVIRLN